jgi:lysyl-tRNA synthetase class 2
VDWISYREALITHAGIDYVTATEQQLMQCLTDRGIEPYPNLIYEGRDAILNVILSTIVEPALRRMELCILWEFPASQAALSQLYQKGDEMVAERFEIFYQGIELANGYHELVDADEQRQRLIEANKRRMWEGREALPIDERFLADLKQGIPDCCGVAVGFDRLMMLRHEASDISQVIPFGWNEI